MSKQLIDLIDENGNPAKSIVRYFRFGQRMFGHYKQSRSNLPTAVYRYLRDLKLIPDTGEAFEAFLLGWQDAAKNGNVDQYIMSNNVLQVLNNEAEQIIKNFKTDGENNGHSDTMETAAPLAGSTGREEESC
jgi:hypothetical protein